MMIKRSREEGSDLEDLHMVNYLMLLSGAASRGGIEEPSRVFECKTCNRQFQSFQALGGHRASHKKPRLTTAGEEHLEASPPPPPPLKAKSHECSICGLEFPIGQALGGHMRRHRSAANDQKQSPIEKKSNSRKVLCLDLNLTPLENKFVFGNVIPAVDCLF